MLRVSNEEHCICGLEHEREDDSDGSCLCGVTTFDRRPLMVVLVDNSSVDANSLK